MAARAMWKGAITFGLVSIPVELHTAVRDHRPKFRLLHAKDKSPIKYERVCITDGKSVAWEDLVKGYEYEKGQFVVLTKDDFQRAAVEKSKAVQVLDFVEPEEVDDRYFETPYYLTPGAGGDRPYALFREAIRESGKIAIAKIILRDAQHLAAIEVIGDALVLSMMRFADELVDVDAFKFPSAHKVSQKEMDLAKSLIGSFVSDWDPDRYTDEYRDNLMRIIDAKVKGRKPRLESGDVEPKQAEVIDLMTRLRKSLQASSPRRQTKSTKTASSARKKRAASPKSRRKTAKHAA
jgi:DNA end-binding protein Ku